MILSECRKQAWAGNEANIHKASFTERRLFYLNCHNHRHTCTCVRCRCCEEGALPDEAISHTLAEIAHLHWRAAQVSGTNKYTLAMTMYKGMQ